MNEAPVTRERVIGRLVSLRESKADGTTQSRHCFIEPLSEVHLLEARKLERRVGRSDVFQCYWDDRLSEIDGSR